MNESKPTGLWSSRRPGALGWLLFLGVALLLVYAPLLRAIGLAAVTVSQLSTGGLLVIFAFALCLHDALHDLEVEFRVGNYGLYLLGGGIAAMFGAARWPGAALPLMLASFSCCFLAAVSFVFGRVGVRRFRPAVAGLVALGLMAGLFPTLDWPLRALAAKYAALLLHHFGLPVRLALTAQRAPALVIEMQGRVFEVAAECNGFGLLTSSLVAAAMLAFVYRLRWFRKIALGVFAALLALGANFLRIVAICLLATHTALPYAAIHESVGILFYTSALAALWGMARQAEEPAPLPPA